jgi:KDO2-lipid IV(A) lauroyltransferase
MSLFINAFANILGFLTSKLPRQWLRKSGAWLGFLWFDVFQFRKKIVLDNLEIAFPEWPLEKRLEVGRQSVYNLGYNATELLTVPFIDKTWIKKNNVFEGYENIEKARALGKGMLFLSLHLGNGDLGATMIVMQGQELFLITKRFKTKWFDNMWFSIRGAKGVQYIDAHAPNNAFDILKALKKNAAVVFVLDQFMGKPYGIAAKFFGRETGTAYGLALFAQKTKAPVLPIYTYEGPDKKMHMVIEPAMDLSPYIAADKDQTTLNLTQAFNNKLEEIVRKHPEQWMWVHRRWKEFR